MGLKGRKVPDIGKRPYRVRERLQKSYLDGGLQAIRCMVDFARGVLLRCHYVPRTVLFLVRVS